MHAKSIFVKKSENYFSLRTGYPGFCPIMPLHNSGIHNLQSNALNALTKIIFDYTEQQNPKQSKVRHDGCKNADIFQN